MAEKPYKSPFHVTEHRRCIACWRTLTPGQWSRVGYGVHEAQCDCGQRMLLWEYEDGTALNDVRF